MTRSPRTPAALLAATVLVAVPLSVAAQTPTEAPPGPRGAWTTSPLERVLDRAESLELTAQQTERLTAALEAWRTASAEPLARLEALAAERRAALAATREERREAMEARREAQRQRMQERREALEGRPERLRPDSLRADSLREGRRGMVRSRSMPPRGMGARLPDTGLDDEARSELREAMASLRELRQEQTALIREVLSEDQLRALRTEVAGAREMRRGGGGMLRPGGPRVRPGRGGGAPSRGFPRR